MLIFTDNIEFARACIPGCEQWREKSISQLNEEVRTVALALFDSDSVWINDQTDNGYWNYLFAIDKASQSQYDVLSKLAVSEHPPPGRTLCCAAEGNKFHGFKNRHWQAIRGNIHLSAFVRPQKEIIGDSAGLIVASVMAVLQTVQSFDLQDVEIGIKWVNDILIEQHKVGGVLARLQKLCKVTESAVMGIGLNVSESPQTAFDSFVPGVAAIADFTGRDVTCRHVDAFPRLLDYLGTNLELLLTGGYPDLLAQYRRFSLVLGREVGIYRDSIDSSDALISTGVVEAIGDSLELFLSGTIEPLTNGRLKLL